MALLVLDEQIENPNLITGLRGRGIDANTVGDLGATGRPDPEVIRRVQDELGPRSWVLVTMDLTIVEDHERFDWERYAIAWIVVNDTLRGGQVEHAKADIVHRHAHVIRQQTRGEHHTYTAKQRFKHRPSLASLVRHQGR